MRYIKGSTAEKYITEIYVLNNWEEEENQVPYECSYSEKEKRPRVICFFEEFYPVFELPYYGTKNMEGLQVGSGSIPVGIQLYETILDYFEFYLKEPLLKSENENDLRKFDDHVKNEVEDFFSINFEGKVLTEAYDTDQLIGRGNV